MNRAAKDVLDNFLEILGSNLSQDQVIKILQDKKVIAEDFEIRYLYGLEKEEMHFSKKGFKEDGLNKLTVYMEAKDGMPYRIEIIKSKTWKIASFMFLCMGCFGNYNDCEVCGGEGWGVL